MPINSVPDPNALATDARTGKTTATAASTIEPVVVTLGATETVADVLATLKDAGVHEMAHVSIMSQTFGFGAVRVASGRLKDLLSAPVDSRPTGPMPPQLAPRTHGM